MHILVKQITFVIVGTLPYPPEYTNQSSYEAVLGFLPRIVLASLVAYVVGEFVNSMILAKMKTRHKGKHLWARLIGSTVAGELLDTVLFCLIAFGGILTGVDMLRYIVVGWLFKIAVEIVLLPVTYRVIAYLKRAEGVDADDGKTDFTPLSMSLTS